MEVSWKGGTQKIIHFNGIFPYKPSSFGYPHLWRPPNGSGQQSHATSLSAQDVKIRLSDHSRYVSQSPWPIQGLVFFRHTFFRGEQSRFPCLTGSCQCSPQDTHNRLEQLILGVWFERLAGWSHCEQRNSSRVWESCGSSSPEPGTSWCPGLQLFSNCFGGANPKKD